MMYEEKETPVRYGIMYYEVEGVREETTWYKTKEERDHAIEFLLQHGKLEIQEVFSPVGRMISPRAFNAIDAAEKYFRRMES